MATSSRSRISTASSEVASGSLLSRLKRSSFGVVHLMLDSRSSTLSTRLITLALLIPRFLTTASLAVDPESKMNSFLSVFRIEQFFNIQGDPVVFLSAYVLALAIVWTSLTCAAATASFFATGHFHSFLPALFLRAVVGLFITALLNPLIELFLLPLECSTLSIYFPHTLMEADARGLPSSLVLNCSDGGLGTLQTTLIVLSAVSLAAFLPFAIATKSLYLETDPVTLDPAAAHTGRVAALETIVRAALVAITYFVQAPHPALHAVLVLLLCIPLVIYTAFKQPFYSTAMNSVTCTMYSFVAWMAVESLVLLGMDKNDPARGAAAEATIALLVIVLPAAALVPFVLKWRLRQTLSEVLEAVKEKQLAERQHMLSKGSFVVRMNDGRQIVPLPSHPTAGRINGNQQQHQQHRNSNATHASSVADVTATGLLDHDNDVVTTAGHGHGHGHGHAHAHAHGEGGSTMSYATVVGAFGNGDTGAAVVAVASPAALVPPVSSPAINATISAMKKNTALSNNNGTPSSIGLLSPTSTAALAGVQFISVRDGSMQSAQAARLFHDRPELVNAVALLCVRTNPMPDLLSAAEHRRHFQAGFYPREAIGRAESVFEMGLLAFPTSADVTVSYARFLGSFVKDPARASGMLQRAAKCSPTFEHRFAIFSYGRFLEQRRAKEDVGEGGLDGLGVIAFRQNYAAALSAYRSAVSHIAALWKSIEVHRKAVRSALASIGDAGASGSGGIAGANGASEGGGGSGAGAGSGAGSGAGAGAGAGGNAGSLLTTASLMQRIGKVVSSRAIAQKEFDKLLVRYTSAAQVLQSYAAFLQQCWMDDAASASATARATAVLSGAEKPDGHNATGDETDTARVESVTPSNVGRSSQGKSSSGGGPVSSVADSSVSRGSRGSSSTGRQASVSGARGGAEKSRFSSAGTEAVFRLRWRMQIGVAALAALSIGIFVITRVVLSDFASLVRVIFASGRRRYQIVSAAYQTRTCSLATADNVWGQSDMADQWDDARRTILSDMQEMSLTNEDMYDPTDTRGVRFFPTVQRLYDEPLYKLNYVLGDLNSSRMTGFQEAAEAYAGAATAAAHMPRDAVKFPSSDMDINWRFVQDNWYFLFVGANNLVMAYVDRAFELGTTFSAASWGLFAVVCAVLFVLWQYVFIPSLKEVQTSNAGVVSIIEAIPLAVVSAQAKKYSLLDVSLHAQTDRVLGEDDDGDSQRGMDDDEEGGEGESSDGDSSSDDTGGGGGGGNSRSRRSSSSGQSDNTAQRFDEGEGEGGAATARVGANSRHQHHHPVHPPSHATPVAALGAPPSAIRGSAAAAAAANQRRNPSLPHTASQTRMAHFKPEGLTSPGAKDPEAVLFTSPQQQQQQLVQSHQSHLQQQSEREHTHASVTGSVVDTIHEAAAEENGSRELFPAAAVASPLDGGPPATASSASSASSSAAAGQTAAAVVGLSSSSSFVSSVASSFASAGALSPPSLWRLPSAGAVAAEGSTIVFVASPTTDPTASSGNISTTLNQSLRSSKRRSNRSKGANQSTARAGGKNEKSADGDEEDEDEKPSFNPRVWLVRARNLVVHGRTRVSRRRRKGGPRSSSSSTSTATLSPLLRALALRMFCALLILFSLQALATGLNTSEVLASTHTASALDVAGYRRELAVTTVFQARELIVGPDIIGTYSLAADTMRQYTDNLRRYHRALLLGDDSLRIVSTIGQDPLQDDLLFHASPAAYQFVPAANLTNVVDGNSAVATQGMNYLILRFLHEADQFLTRFEPWHGTEERKAWYAATFYNGTTPPFNATASGGCGHDLICIWKDEPWVRLYTMGSQLLDADLESSIRLFMDQVETRANRGLVIQVAVLVLNLLVLVALYMIGLKRSFASMNQEATRTLELIRLIPVAAIDQSAKLRALIHLDASSGGSSTSTGASRSSGKSDGESGTNAGGTTTPGMSESEGGGGGGTTATPGAGSAAGGKLKRRHRHHGNGGGSEVNTPMAGVGSHPSRIVPQELVASPSALSP